MHFIVYLSGTPFTNKNFPNIWNSFQSAVVDFYTSVWGWEIQCFKNNENIVVAGSYDSVKIYSIKDSATPVVLSKIYDLGASFDGVHLLNLPDQNILYVGAS